MNNIFATIQFEKRITSTIFLSLHQNRILLKKVQIKVT